MLLPIEKFCITSTYKCNWDCPYCIINTHSQNEITNEDLIFKLNEIPKNSEVSISGGEPGLLSKERLDMIINNLKEKNCIIKVNTNGLFFKKYPDYDNLIKGYLYHFSENLNLNEDNFIPDIDKDKISFMLVVNDDNYPRLDEFLKKYKDIRFSIFAAVKNNSDNKKLILSKKNAFEIFKKYKDIIDKECFSNLLMTCRLLNEYRQMNII